MTTHVVTGWNVPSYNALGRQFENTFIKYWPKDVDLIIFRDWEKCDGLAGFLSFFKDNKHANGRLPVKGWKPRDIQSGYTFKFDAVKFAPQMFVMETVAKDLPDGDIIAWFDCDVVSYRPIPPDFIESLIGDSDIVFLGREPKHSEIGFWAVRLSQQTRRFLSGLADWYRDRTIFGLDEWHSAFVFDATRKKYVSDLRQRDLTPGGRGHVWFKCPLGDYTDHLKGDRKKIGYSKERMRKI